MRKPKSPGFEKIAQHWQEYSLRKKITLFMAAVFWCIFLSVLFSAWVAEVSLGDFHEILGDGSKSSAFVQAMNNESRLFEQYMKQRTEENEKLLAAAMQVTKDAVEELPDSYRIIGKERYALTWSIRNCYEVYGKLRDEVFSFAPGSDQYLDQLYIVYDIQDYLRGYGTDLVNDTISAGSAAYQTKISKILIIPAIMTGVFVVLLLFMLELSRMMNDSIVNPILLLADFAKRIADNEFFIEDIPLEGKDEIGQLIRTFNRMKYATGNYILAMEENRKTLDALHEQELQKLEAERRLETMKLEVLVNQVNPHFLFNTLNVIGGMAMLENAETTERMIMALSNLFRYNLKNSSSQAILSQELNVVRDYMYIQQMRFGERLDFEIACDREYHSIVIPTFTFQPLVENAIIHGLSKKEEGGKIQIKVWDDEKFIFITVQDTGIGMSEEQLEKLKKKLEEGNVSRDSIGVGNVYRRFKIMYPEGQFTIYSRENQGTLIKLQIPKGIEKGESNDKDTDCR